MIQPPVTVVGLGSMGTALADAFLAAGHPTTVWNRGPAKAAPLVARGATHHESIDAAMNPLVVTCLTTFDATIESLAPADLTGRTLVTLNSGIPAGAREMAAWAAGRGARFLAGAVKNVPSAVGRPDTLLYYAGAADVFAEHAETLRVLGGDTVHLGEEPDLAALYETAVGGMLLPALLGFFQGAALVTARGLPARSLVRYAEKWLEMIASVLPTMADEIDSGDYSEPASSLGLFDEGIPQDYEAATAAGLDAEWLLPMLALLRRGVAAGYGDQSISALVEVLRTPPP